MVCEVYLTLAIKRDPGLKCMYVSERERVAMRWGRRGSFSKEVTDADTQGSQPYKDLRE